MAAEILNILDRWRDGKRLRVNIIMPVQFFSLYMSTIDQLVVNQLFIIVS